YRYGGQTVAMLAPQPEAAAVSDEEEAARREKKALTSRGVGGVVGGVEGGISSGSYGIPGPPPPTKADLSNLLYHDPSTVVQTGPGIPSWGWQEVSLRWRGPVERSQRLRLFLVP